MRLLPQILFKITLLMIFMLLFNLSIGSAAKLGDKSALFTIGKYGYAFVSVELSPSSSCRKYSHISITPQNISKVLRYNLPVEGRLLIDFIIKNNYSTALNVSVCEDRVVRISFKFNIFNVLNREVITGIEGPDYTCLGGNISTLELFRRMKLIKLLESSNFSIYLRFVYGEGALSRLVGKVFELNVNDSALQEVPAALLGSRLGLPRVVVLSAGQLAVVDVGEVVKLWVGYINMSDYLAFTEEGVKGASGAHVDVPGMVTIRAPYLKPLQISYTEYGCRPRVLRFEYVNDTGIVSFYFYKCPKGKHEALVSFVAVREGNYTMDVTERFFLPGNKTLVLKRYAVLLNPYGQCGVLVVRPVVVERVSGGSPWYFAALSVALVATAIVFIAWYYKR